MPDFTGDSRLLAAVDQGAGGGDLLEAAFCGSPHAQERYWPPGCEDPPVRGLAQKQATHTLSDVADGADAPDGWTILTSSGASVAGSITSPSSLVFMFAPTSC